MGAWEGVGGQAGWGPAGCSPYMLPVHQVRNFSNFTCSHGSMNLNGAHRVEKGDLLPVPIMHASNTNFFSLPPPLHPTYLKDCISRLWSGSSICPPRVQQVARGACFCFVSPPPTPTTQLAFTATQEMGDLTVTLASHFYRVTEGHSNQNAETLWCIKCSVATFCSFSSNSHTPVLLPLSLLTMGWGGGQMER